MAIARKVKTKGGGSLKEIKFGPVSTDVPTPQGLGDLHAPEVAITSDNTFQELQYKGGLPDAAGTGQNAHLGSGKQVSDKLLWDQLKEATTKAHITSKYWGKNGKAPAPSKLLFPIHTDYITGSEGPTKMHVKLKNITGELDFSDYSFKDMLDVVGEFMATQGAEGKKLWDCLVALRGPDTGSKGGVDFEDGRDAVARKAREARKAETASIIRGYMFPKGLHGNMKVTPSSKGAVVSLPAAKDWDHYDAHAFEVCDLLQIPCTVAGQPIVGGVGKKGLKQILEDALPEAAPLSPGDLTVLVIPGVQVKKHLKKRDYMEIESYVNAGINVQVNGNHWVVREYGQTSAHPLLASQEANGLVVYSTTSGMSECVIVKPTHARMGDKNTWYGLTDLEMESLCIHLGISTGNFILMPDGKWSWKGSV